MDSNLSLRLHALPSELFLFIKALVLSPDNTGHSRAIMMDHSWCPPSVHQLNTTTRGIHTSAYYTTHIFDFSTLPSTSLGISLCARWLDHLDRGSRAGIRRIRFAASYNSPPAPPLDCSTLWSRMIQRPSQEISRLDLKNVEPLSARKLADWINRQAEEIVPSLTEQCLGRFEWEQGGFLLYTLQRAEIKILWCGADGTARETWVHLHQYKASKALVSAVKEECVRIKTTIEAA
nr:hypothetical protein B0A51_05598 [Rachicladosporium sp. CCFEE 5018]